MNIFNFTDIYIFLPIYTVLFALSILGTIFPEKVIAFRKNNPLLYLFILFLAGIVQFPILINGYWEIGIAYSKLGRNNFFDLSISFLPFLYLAIFIFSIYFQQKKKDIVPGLPSFTLAVYSSIILCPSLYLSLMSTLYYLLR